MLNFSTIIKQLQKVHSELVYISGNSNKKAFNAYKSLYKVLEKSSLFHFTGKDALTENASYKLKRLCFYDRYDSKIKQFHVYMFYMGVLKDIPLYKAKYAFYKFIGIEDNLPVIRLAKVTDVIRAVDSYISLFKDLKQAIHFEHTNANPQGQIFYTLLPKLGLSDMDLLTLEKHWKTKVLPLRISLERCIAIIAHYLNDKKVKWNYHKMNYLRVYMQKLRSLKGRGVLGAICYVNKKDYEPVSMVPMSDMKAIKRAMCESACKFSKPARVYVLTHCGLKLRPIADKYDIEPSQLQELRDNIITYMDLTYAEIFKLCDVFHSLKSHIRFDHVSIMLSRY